MDILDVEKNKCIGCGACISIDEEHFDWDDDGLSKVISQDNLKSESVIDAIESCPTSAIRLSKTDAAYDGNVEDNNEGITHLENVMASETQES